MYIMDVCIPTPTKMNNSNVISTPQLDDNELLHEILVLLRQKLKAQGPQDGCRWPFYILAFRILE